MNDNRNNAQTQKSPLGDSSLSGRQVGVIKAIIFDLDGTLLDSVADIAAANNRVLEAEGLPMHSVQKYIEFIGNGARRLVQLALPEHWQNDETKVNEFLTNYKAAYKANLVDKSRLFEGIPELLTFLNKNEIPIAINTNKPHDQTKLIVDQLLRSWDFEVVLGQQDSFPRKPDPTGALSIAKTLNLEPEEVLFVGDSGVDVETAKNAGMQLLCVEWGYSPKQEMVDAGCEQFVRTTSELKEYIKARINK